jgi:ferredoxin
MARDLYFKKVEQTGYYERFYLESFAYKKRNIDYDPKDWKMDFPQFDRFIFDKAVSTFTVTGEHDVRNENNDVIETVKTTIDQCPVSQLEWIEYV